MADRRAAAAARRRRRRRSTSRRAARAAGARSPTRDGEFAGVANALHVDGAAGVFDVHTPDAERRRGIGWATTQAGSRAGVRGRRDTRDRQRDRARRRTSTGPWAFARSGYGQTWWLHRPGTLTRTMTDHPCRIADVAIEWLETMTLIRRFEERAGEMYAKAKVGGFLHLAIGEEATIVGSVRAMRDRDYLISTYRSHGHALVRGTNPDNVMAELFGRVDGVCKGRGGSMHMFDLERRFMGGYGIVGGNLPIAAGFALAPTTWGPTTRRCASSATAPPTRARSARRSTSPRCGACRSSSWSPTTSSAWARRSSATRRSPTCTSAVRASASPGCSATGWTCSTPTR